MDAKACQPDIWPLSIAAVCQFKTNNSHPILGRELAHVVPPGLCPDPAGLRDP